MTVGEFCNREVVVAEKETTIVEAAKLMRKYHVGDLVVVDRSGGRTIPVGIVTDRDIVVELVAGEVDLDAACAGDIMSHELMTAGDHDGILETLQKMRGKGIRRLPVVNGQGGLEGILAIDDLLELLAEELTLLAKAAGRGQERERKLRP
ncbi:MAG: CBS domain-containing protein [Deltaproteobacteria bacterium]|nr:CBS domain-containing protein [Deltaproteobacteria bacterium]